MRKLTQTEKRIVELLAEGVRPKRNCTYPIHFIRNSALASC